MMRHGMFSAVALASVAGLASAQPVIDGVLSPAEEAIYGPIRWANTVPTGFGDNELGEFTGGEFGNPEAVTTGIEFSIPKAALGSVTSFDISGWINSGDRSFLSNQVIGQLPIDTTNLGGVGEPPRDFSDETLFPGNQFVSVSGVPMGTPTIDGTLDAVYGDAFFIQTNFTGFGDNESEINGLYVAQDADNFYIMITGNIQDNGNAIDLYFDTGPGGQEELGTSGGSPDIPGGQEGHTFDTGFTPDFFVSIDSFDDDADGATPNVPRVFYGIAESFGDFDQLLAGNIAGFGPANAGVVMGGDANAPAIELAIDNSNTEGVTGTPSLATPSAPDPDFAYGSELANLRATVDADAGVLNLFIGGNLNIEFERLVLLFDAQPGGQNTMRNDNVDISFNGLNRLGADPDATPEDLETAPGLTFDDGFAADYWLNLNTGLDGGSGNLINFTDAVVLRTDGPLFEFDSIIDYGSFFGGDIADGAGEPVEMPVQLMDFSGPQIDPQDGTAASLFSNFGPRDSTAALLDNPFSPVGTPGLIQIALDNSNIGGVTESAADAAAVAAVDTGIEIQISLDELGWDGVQDILIVGYISNQGFDFASNQILGDAIAVTAETDENGDGILDNLGEVREIDFGDFAGDQFVNLSAEVMVDEPCNAADLAQTNGMFGSLDGADVSAFIQAFLAGGMAADTNDDGAVNGADISTFVQAFVAGCP